MADRKQKTVQKPELTVVIGTLNRPKVVWKLIQQLHDELQTPPLEIIVIDQSDDENSAALQEMLSRYRDITLVRQEANTCRYLNYGWRHAHADIVLYLDDDVSITDRTLTAHRQAYADLSVQGVAGRVINDGQEISNDGNVGRILWYGAIITKNFSYDKTVFVDFPYGCNMSFRKQALEAVGGFDEHLSAPIYSFNEVDAGFRIAKRWKNSLLFLPEALVYHHRFGQGGTRNRFSQTDVVRSNNFNYGYFLGKNFNLLQNTLWSVRRMPYQLIKEPATILDIARGFLHGKKGR